MLSFSPQILHYTGKHLPIKIMRQNKCTPHKSFFFLISNVVNLYFLNAVTLTGVFPHDIKHDSYSNFTTPSSSMTKFRKLDKIFHDNASTHGKNTDF